MRPTPSYPNSAWGALLIYCTNYSAARTSFCSRALAGALGERVTQGVTRTRAGRGVSGVWCGGADTENVRAGGLLFCPSVSVVATASTAGYFNRARLARC